MAEKLEWTELSGNGGSEHGLASGRELLELQRMLGQARPWWHKGACWFVAFCLVNAVGMLWADALGAIEMTAPMYVLAAFLIVCAGLAGAVQSVQSRRG